MEGFGRPRVTAISVRARGLQKSEISRSKSFGASSGLPFGDSSAQSVSHPSKPVEAGSYPMGSTGTNLQVFVCFW